MQSSKKWFASGITACSMTMPLLRLQLFDEGEDFLQRRDAVLVAVDEQARRRAWGQEAEVEAVGRRRDGDKALDLGTPHEELHADPRAEGDARDPAGARLGADRLSPVQRGGRVGKLALAVVEGALRAADPAEVEPQHGKPALGEIIVGAVDDLIVHRAAELRVRMQHDRDRGASLFCRMKAAFQPTGGTVEKDLGHENSKTTGRPATRRPRPPAGPASGDAACGAGPARLCLVLILSRRGLASEAAS